MLGTSTAMLKQTLASNYMASNLVLSTSRHTDSCVCERRSRLALVRERRARKRVQGA